MCGSESGKVTRERVDATCKRCKRTDAFRLGDPMERLAEMGVTLDVDLTVTGTVSEGTTEVDDDGNPL